MKFVRICHSTIHTRYLSIIRLTCYIKNTKKLDRLVSGDEPDV